MSSTQDRLHALDAVRAFALLVGIAFHAAFSFIPGLPPGLWAIKDVSPSATLDVAAFVSHIFRMSLFFFIAGFFARMLVERNGTRGFWANRLKRILVPLVVGWVVTFPLIAVAWTMGMRKMLGAAAAATPPALPAIFGWFPIAHLWFLLVLLQLYVCLLVLRWAVNAVAGNGKLHAMADATVRGLLNGYWAPFVLGVPLALCLYTLPAWTYWAGIPAPDQTWLPKLTPLVGYGTAMGLGWLVHRQKELLASIQQRWIGHLAIGVVATVATVLIMMRHEFAPAVPGTERAVFVACFTIALWGWVIGLTGLALARLSGFGAVRRYLADSSYWLYLMHLPLVAALQVWVGKWNLHWSVKYPFVVLSALAILLVTYHFLVRPSFIGAVLNGNRIPIWKRAPATAPAAAEALALNTVAGPDSPTSGTQVAELIGASRSYGKTLALDDVSLQVKRGELLAVLGPNGAGKTTAIALWLGLIEPDKGTVSLMGGLPSDVDCRRRVGVMMQEVEISKQLKVRELIALTASYYPNPLSVNETLELTRTTDLADRNYSKLSGGQKRKVQFALAVCGRPELMFLDEPTAGLDLQARETMWATIRDMLVSGCSIVLTTHYLEEAEALADRVVVLARSRVIASGSVDEMRALVSRKQINCESRTSAEEIRSWPGVTEVIRDEQKLHITAIDAEDVVRRLLAADQNLRKLEVRQAGLTEAFAQLTKEAA